MHHDSPAFVFALGATAVLQGRTAVDELHEHWNRALGRTARVGADDVFGAAGGTLGFGELLGRMRTAGVSAVRLAPPSPLGPLGLPRLSREDRRRLLGETVCVAETDRTARAVLSVSGPAVRVHACAPIRYQAGAATGPEAMRQLREAVLAALLQVGRGDDLGYELTAWQERAVAPGAVELPAPLPTWFPAPEAVELAELSLRLSELAGQLADSPWELPPGSPMRELSQAAAEGLLAATRP
ncbi:hypothetical protein [Sediminivirga luteola]|uniref:Uncharacterized protein n=1 Tax=Sediminivirga luteola TaxID=1774748 RepID=A0A8J2U063_9MICO|nr:hypothetical protein [Sediminivirga luteola]MCI2264065.1 hypothetical protein [Sediminivirga luteola]GGA22638.1 hypothetical protein GCM10011333_27030 [Sediminivirga luteola]